MKQHAGFTLISLLYVIGATGILAAIIGPKITKECRRIQNNGAIVRDEANIKGG